MKNFVGAECKFSSHLTALFLAPATAKRTCEQAKIIFKDVHYKSKYLAEESRYTSSLVLVAFICYRRKR